MGSGLHDVAMTAARFAAEALRDAGSGGNAR
jgi:hypothetical protein